MTYEQLKSLLLALESKLKLPVAGSLPAVDAMINPLLNSMFKGVHVLARPCIQP
jgi:hypothetical protein